jgi:Tautomerase enzyme
MPVAKIHVLEGRYDERRLTNVSKAVQDALISILKIPPDDFFQIIHELPRNRFLHTPSFLGMKYSDDFILLEVAFISGRPKETRLALLKELNQRIAAGAGISPDDVMIRSRRERFVRSGVGATRVRFTGSLKEDHHALPTP